MCCKENLNSRPTLTPIPSVLKHTLRTPDTTTNYTDSVHCCRLPGTTLPVSIVTMCRSVKLLSAAVLVASALLAAAQPNQVIPAAADTSAAPAPGRPLILDFKDLGDCTADTGLTAQQEYCQTSAALTKPGQAHWYRFNVLEEQSALTLHFLIRTQNGRVRM